MIELARKSFNDDTGRQLVDFIWSQPTNNDNTYLRNKNIREERPHSVYELNSTDKMNGYSTLPTRGKSSSRQQRYNDGTSSDIEDVINSEKSTWYKEMYNMCRPNQPEKGKCFFFPPIIQFYYFLFSLFN